MTKKFAFFQVSLKILLKKKNGKVLLLRARKGDIDLPGGRIDSGEEKKSLEEIVKREVQEELGGDIVFKLGRPLFQYRIYMHRTKTYEFVVVYEAQHLEGKITLSEEHKEYLWIHPRALTLLPADFRVQDQEKSGAFRAYFDTWRSLRSLPNPGREKTPPTLAPFPVHEKA
ncbi:MAG: NUDIX hydrolase [Candidatus Yanofskybacteria bacterium]|nr:NUDIX hydrolase [Candidatus Yanofskybacteria bacterium]